MSELMGLADENKKRLEEIRKKLLEALDLTISPEEAERRKREAISPDIQGKKKEEKFTEEELRDDYPFEKDEDVPDETETQDEELDE